MTGMTASFWATDYDGEADGKAGPPKRMTMPTRTIATSRGFMENSSFMKKERLRRTGERPLLLVDDNELLVKANPANLVIDFGYERNLLYRFGPARPRPHIGHFAD